MSFAPQAVRYILFNLFRRVNRPVFHLLVSGDGNVL